MAQTDNEKLVAGEVSRAYDPLRSASGAIIAKRAIRFIVFLTLLGACTSAATNPLALATLTVPPVGETESTTLDDGHPVFVVHDLVVMKQSTDGN